MNQLKYFLIAIIFCAMALQDPSYASASSLGQPCSKIGLSSIANGHVITCNSTSKGSRWVYKSTVKVGTTPLTQDMRGDYCASSGERISINGLVYKCNLTYSGLKWQYSTYIKFDSAERIQSIESQSCPVPHEQTILNGVPYVCTLQGRFAHWQGIYLVKANTRIKNNKLLGTKCTVKGSMTLLSGNFYRCSNASKWDFVEKQVFPKVIPAPKSKSLLECPSIKDINKAISTTNSSARIVNNILNLKLRIMATEPTLTSTQRNDQNYLNYKSSIDKNLVNIYSKWKTLSIQATTLVKAGGLKCVKYEKDILHINSQLASQLGFNP